MSQLDLPKLLCPRCNIRKSGRYPGKLCRVCYDEKRKTRIVIGAEVPQDLQDRVRLAQTSGDWKALADSLGDTIKDVANGNIKATAAQGSMLKHIMDRAYGRVSKSQEDKQGPVGLVILPTIGRDNSEDLRVCPTCAKNHLEHM
jgi:hypothetical protein